jgi:hypothetical protein
LGSPLAADPACRGGAATVVLPAGPILLARDQLLFEGSDVTLPFHGLEGWSREELAVPEPESAERLEVVARGMMANLRAHEDGLVRFVRRRHGNSTCYRDGE